MSKSVCGIDADILKEIGDIFTKTNIEEIELEEEDKFYIKVSRKRPDMPVMAAAPVAMAPAALATAPVAAAAPAAAPAPAAPAPAQFDNADKYHKILSPVIGTYYESSTPGGNPFVKVGDTVSPDTTVCIVEAMKVMNEIKAEIKGKIVSVAKANGESVLANEVLFVVEKK